MDDVTNPFTQLLANHPSADLENPFKKHTPQKQPTVSAGPKEDTHISLSIRQPSFSSLSSTTVVTKGGDVVNELPSLDEQEDSDPLIVFDGKSESSDSSQPIGLQVRQPSFSSLHGQIIPKGSGCLSEYIPVIKEVEPLSPQPLEEEGGEEDDDPHVLFVKELKARNMNRWKEMGYEPPDDLIPLARAASQALLQYNSKLEGASVPYRRASFNYFSVPLPETNIQVPALMPVIEEQTPTNTPPRKALRPRSGSFGMGIGEASRSEALMQEIIQVEPHVEETIEENDDDDYFESEGYGSEYYNLFGHLSEIVEEDEGSLVYKAIAQNTAEICKNNQNSKTIISQVIKKLKFYIEECTKEIWVEEVEYLDDIVQRLNAKIKELGSPQKSINGSPERLKSVIAAEEAGEEEYQEAVESVERQKEEELQQIRNEIERRREEVNKKFDAPGYIERLARPSKQLLDLKAQARAALSARLFAEAKTIASDVKRLEAKEREKAQTDLKRMRRAELERLDDEERARTAAVERRWNYRLQNLDAKHASRKEAMAKSRRAIEASPTSSPRRSAKPSARKAQTVKRQRIGQAEVPTDGPLLIESPPSIDRSSDLDVIDEMAKQIMSGQKPDIERAFRTTRRK